MQWVSGHYGKDYRMAFELEQLWGMLNWIIVKIAGLLFNVSTIIGDKFGFESKNVYLILLFILSLFAGAQITENKGLKLLIITAIIFGVFYKFGGII